MTLTNDACLLKVQPLFDQDRLNCFKLTSVDCRKLINKIMLFTLNSRRLGCYEKCFYLGVHEIWPILCFFFVHHSRSKAWAASWTSPRGSVSPPMVRVIELGLSCCAYPDSWQRSVRDGVWEHPTSSAGPCVNVLTPSSRLPIQLLG